jgi:hypothetical protein
MNKKIKTIVLLSASMCTPVYGVRIQIKNEDGVTYDVEIKESNSWDVINVNGDSIVTFYAKGYLDKTYRADNLPDIVRLLEDKIIGYQDKLWYVPGDTVHVYVNSSEAYTSELYRHGISKKSCLRINKKPAMKQKVPDGFFVEDGLSWQESFSYDIPESIVPGLYSMMLKADSGLVFSIPLIISSAQKSKNKMLVLASTNTWQSYNLWGGRSRYRNYEGNDNIKSFIPRYKLMLIRISEMIARRLPESIIAMIKGIIGHKDAAWKLKKLTIKRPFTNCYMEGDDPCRPFTNHLAGSEWRLLAWLEREGYEYDIVSGYELHNNPEIIKRYKALILSTHCEYWTSEMYDAVFDAHYNNRLCVLNLSGNTMYRQIKIYSDGSTRCVNLSFNRGHRDESQITGVRFSMRDYGTCAPYEIIDTNHWAFRGLKINPGYKLFGEKSLLQNTSL